MAITYGRFKEELMTALHDAVCNFNQDNDPNGAVVKSAMLHGFNPEQTKRLVETFNTARTIYHFKNAADRSVEFPLAEGDKVLPAVFGPEKLAADTPAVDADYSCYERPESDQTEDSMDKAAAASDMPEPRVHIGNVDLALNMVAHQAMRAVRVQRDLSKTAADEARIAGTVASRILTKIAGDIARMYPDVYQEKMARLFALEGNAGVGAAIHQLHSFLPSTVEVSQEKIASAQAEPFVDTQGLEEMLAQLKEAEEWMAKESEMLAISNEFDKEANDFEAEFMAEINPLFPQRKEATLGDFFRLGDKAAAEATQTTKYAPTLSRTGQIAGAMGLPVTPGKTIMGTPYEREKTVTQTGSDLRGDIGGAIRDQLMDSGIKAPIKNTLEMGIERAFVGPQERENKKVSDRLRNIQRQIMMEELVATDPVLSEEDPETVIHAYNSLQQIAPDLSTNKEVVRAILRQAVHSVAISPYDAEQWARLETSMRNIAGKNVKPQQEQKQLGSGGHK